MAKRYDRWSPIYDLADGAGPLGSSERRWRRIVAEIFSDSRGWVLDAACGTGMMAEYLQEVGFEGKMLLVDASKKMVRRAKERCKDLDFRCAVVLADVNRLPIKPDSLDGIMCTFSLTTVRDPKIALGELAGSLGTGNRLVILDSEKPSHPMARVLYPALVPISRMFCHTHIDRDVHGMLESIPKLEVQERNGFMGGMVAIYHCKKPHNPTFQR